MLRTTFRRLTIQPVWEKRVSRVALRTFCDVQDDPDVFAVDDRIGRTWKYQDDLPLLPLPSLKETCARYAEHLRPLLQPEQFEEEMEHISKFAGAAIAEDLQSQLENLQATEPSWIEGFWDKMYLDIRDPLPINVNPFFVLKHSWEDKAGGENGIAAKLVTSFIKSNKALKMRKLVPDKEGTRPLCMYQYTKVFGSTRYPRPGADVFGSNRYARNIIVMKRGHLFSLEVENEKKELHRSATIRAGLDKICALAEQKTEFGEMGYFTTTNRDVWANNYQKIQQLSKQNKTNMNTIGGALIIVNLDDEDLDDIDVAAKSMLHNRGVNRWFDKLQLIVGADGTAGINMEHTPVDGHTIVRIATDMHNEMLGDSPFNGMMMDRVEEGESVPPPVELTWDLDDDLREELAKAKAEFHNFADRTETIPIIEKFGKRTMKNCDTSPDAFVQMAIQLAGYRETGKFESTYESALTKQFLHGRTETIRTVSENSKLYCTNFDTEKLVESGALLVEACQKHSEISKLAKNGKGVDRHLFGLYSLAKKEKEMNPDFKIPSIFERDAYKLYGSNVISTSNCGSDAIRLFGFGPVHPRGVGIGYLVNEDRTRICVTGFDGKATSFAKNLTEAFSLQLHAARLHKEARIAAEAAEAAEAAKAAKAEKDAGNADAVDSTKSEK